ncbi:hypothetical protein PY365_31565 [Roseiarcaceae bacterium H3SJ34-1]|uniref:hypothetical protein n=1 Tax=Terripilifer ovatus TaxID=3032367 RepID=UPI003AB95A44|nr:hypothetical protein [Roseiarcaceae bacterium H3SJ34-1]
MPLSASQNPYIATVGHPPLKVRWTETYDNLEIWEKHSKQSPGGFIRRNLTQTELMAHEIIVDINKGEVVTIVLYDGDETHPDPNDNLEDPPPKSLLTVFGIVDEYREMISLPDGIAKGGTYIASSIVTSENCFVLMQVGESEPQVLQTSPSTGVELKWFDAPDAQSWVDSGTSHSCECTPLWPGHLYAVTIIAVADDGFWDCKFDAVQTKNRQVDINIERLFVDNDGDANNAGEAQFWVSVKEGGWSLPITVLNLWSIGNDDYSVYDGESIELGWRTTVGPQRIDKTNEIVAVHTNGMEYDGIFGTDDASDQDGGQRLDFPTGSANEEHTEDSVYLVASPIDAAFAFTVLYNWTVTYVDP